MLEGLLSPSAEELYRRLLSSGIITVGSGGQFATDDNAVRELVSKRFAGWAGDTALVAVAPRLAIEDILLSLQRAITRTHEACINALNVMPVLQETYENSPGGRSDDPRIRIINEQEAAQLAVSLLEGAHDGILVLQTIPTSEYPFWPAVGPEAAAAAAALQRRGVYVRCVLAKEFLDSPDANNVLKGHARNGAEIRAAHALPTTMMIVDSKAALIPLDGGDDGSVVLFRHGAALDLLRAAFELHWRSSVLVTGAAPGPDTPSSTQLLILRLLASGMKDESIARHLTVSLRTVRRHVTALCDKVGVPTRFALAAVAVQRGWITGTAAEVHEEQHRPAPPRVA